MISAITSSQNACHDCTVDCTIWACWWRPAPGEVLQDNHFHISDIDASNVSLPRQEIRLELPVVVPASHDGRVLCTALPLAERAWITSRPA
jgi:hypothetical protein